MLRKIIDLVDRYRLPASESRNKIRGVPGTLISIIAVAWSLFHLITAYSPYIGMYQRGIFALCGVFIILLIFPANSKKPRPTKIHLPSFLAALVAVAAVIYVMVMYSYRAHSFAYDVWTSDLIMGGIFILFVIEACRRTTGWPFTIITILLLIYARFGSFMPELIRHPNYDVERIVSGLYMGTQGIFGMVTGVAATFIFVFILFGAFLRNSGAGDFFLNFANALMGKRRGGAAKIAVVGSTFFGMVSGSALANVAGTGQITIPLMKKTGYKAYFAGGVEAVASAGGQLMPPIMGGTAFIMAEVLGMSYLNVCIAALIIGILYYVDVFFMVDLEAAKTGLVGLDPSQVPSLKETLKKGWHFIVPVIILVYLLASGSSAMRAGFWGTVSIPLISLLQPHGRMTIKQIIRSLEDAAYTSCAIVGIVLAMGIVVGMITLTGLGLAISSVLIELAGGNLFALLVLAMITSIVLGMGVPILCAYIVLAVLVAPALIDFGVVPISAHLFVFYFAILSAVTPPVAPDAYVAAGIAGSPMMKTAVSACKTGLALVILPFIMVYDPGLVMKGEVFDIILVVIRSLAAVFALVAARQGYVVVGIGWIERALMLISTFLLAYPAGVPNIIGYVILGTSFVKGVFKRRDELKEILIGSKNERKGDGEYAS